MLVDRLANTKYPEDGHGTAQMEDTITRLITSCLRGAFGPVRTLLRDEASQELISEATMI